MTFEIPGDDDVAEDRVDATLAATAAAQKANPAVFVGQFGDASADKAISKAFEDDFKKAEVLSLPITLLILVVAFGALVAAGVPLLLGLTAVAATIGLLAPISQLFAMDESVELGGPARRPRGRRRLLDVLPAKEDGGARRRALVRRTRWRSPPRRPARPC